MKKVIIVGLVLLMGCAVGSHPKARRTFKNLHPVIDISVIEGKAFSTRDSHFGGSGIEFYPNNKVWVHSSACAVHLGFDTKPNGEFSIKENEIRLKVDVTAFYIELAETKRDIAKDKRILIGRAQNKLNKARTEKEKAEAKKVLQETQTNLQELEVSLETEIQETQTRLNKQWKGPYVVYENQTNYFLIKRDYFKKDKLPKRLTIRLDKCPVDTVYVCEKKK